MDPMTKLQRLQLEKLQAEKRVLLLELKIEEEKRRQRMHEEVRATIRVLRNRASA